MICNCTLAGTNACNNCPNNSSVTEFSFKAPTKIIVEKEFVDTEHKEGHPILQYWCSECDALLMKYSKYCHNCGIKINWNDVEEDK